MPSKSKQQIARVALVKREVPIPRNDVREIPGTEAIPPDNDDSPAEGGTEGPAHSETNDPPEGRAATLPRDEDEANQGDLTEDTVREDGFLDEQDTTRLAG